LIFWVAAVFLLPVSPIWPPRRPFLPYGRPNLALAGILVFVTDDAFSNLLLLSFKMSLNLMHCAVLKNCFYSGRPEY